MLDPRRESRSIMREQGGVPRQWGGRRPRSIEHRINNRGAEQTIKMSNT